MRAKRILLFLLVFVSCMLVFSACSHNDGYKVYTYDGGGIHAGNYEETLLFNSYEAFENYRAEVNESYNYFIERYCNGVEENERYKSYMGKLNSYDASYFEQSFLIIIHQEECSGSYKLTVKSLEFNETEAVVTIGRYIPFLCTDDMYDWSFIIESEKVGDISQASVKFVEDEKYKK